MQKLTIRRPDDFHVHFRQGDFCRWIVPYTARNFARALVMPNPIPPIATDVDVVSYRTFIKAVAPESFEPLMTIKIFDTTTPATVRQAYQVGVIAGKVYPEGVTTNAEVGVTDFNNLYPVFATMEELEMTLSLHGEAPGSFCLDRERAFIEEVLRDLVKNFPKLKIVLEHITTREAVEVVEVMPSTVAATITVHHLFITLDDVVGDKIAPHNFCKPIAKFPEDRTLLIEAATSGNPKFFLGTDSAPYKKSAKECAAGCAGIFTAPVALPLLAQVFEYVGKLDHLEAFTSVFGATFYNLPLNKGTITLVREPWVIPSVYDSVVPFMAGETLNWKVEA